MPHFLAKNTRITPPANTGEGGGVKTRFPSRLGRARVVHVTTGRPA